jgi:pyridoxine/pyridoxamine 5'-phosphate oxidase
MKTIEDIYEFMDKSFLAVISTTKEDGTPESAVVGFGQTKELEIVFGTENTSRKYANLKLKPNVSFVIGWENGETLQYEGTARELEDSEIDLVKKSYWKKNPKAARYNLITSERYFIVEPSWIRHTDLKMHPWDMSVLKF